MLHKANRQTVITKLFFLTHQPMHLKGTVYEYVIYWLGTLQ
jgi:hypothetical protein